MAVVAQAFFTAAAGTLITSVAPEVGTSWTQHGSYGGAVVVTDRTWARSNAAADNLLYTATNPAGVDVVIEFNMVRRTAVDFAGVAARIVTAANTFYGLYYDAVGATWYLEEKIAGAATNIITHAVALTLGQTYKMKLVITDARKGLWIDGTEVASSTSNGITANGRVGLYIGGANSDTTGCHADNYIAYDPFVAGDAHQSGAYQSDAFQVAVLRLIPAIFHQAVKTASLR